MGQEQANNAVQLRTAVIERNQDLSQLHAVLQDRNKDIVQLQQWGKEQADEIDQLRELLRQLSHEAPIMGVTKSSETEALQRQRDRLLWGRQMFRQLNDV